MIRKSGGDFTGTERFAVLRRIGAGGMGVVYEVYDKSINAHLALKTLPQLNPWSLYRFKREFRSLADLSHPNLVTLYELFADPKQWFFTMQLVRGADFVNYLLRAPQGSNKQLDSTINLPVVHEATTNAHTPTTEFDLNGASFVGYNATEPMYGNFDRLRRILRQLVEGLCALHSAGWLHGDVKPPNVLVNNDERVLLLDFGLARELHVACDIQADDAFWGTIGYMSPETGLRAQLTEASDWYSIGVMLYQVLTGRMPFRGRPSDVLQSQRQFEPPGPSELVRDIPEELDSLCRDLLRRKPELRPTGQEILDRLNCTQDTRVPHFSLNVHRSREVFIGRQEQLRALDEAFRTVTGGNLVAAFVHGIPGIGKTSLVQHFLRDVAERKDVIVLAGRCYEQESVPFKAFDSIVDALAAHLRTLSDKEADVLMPRNVAALAQMFPVLQRVRAITNAPQRRSEIVEQYETRKVAFAALRELFARMGDRAHLVMFIDDLQWGDLDSAALLLDIFRDPDPPAVLLVCCYRTEDLTTSPCLRALHQAGAFPEVLNLPVEPLTPTEARTLAESLLHMRGATSPVIAETLAQESEGSPYFVRELAEHVQTETAIIDTRGFVQKVTLESVLLDRIVALPEDSKRLLETLAVSGKPMRPAEAYIAAQIAERDPLKLSQLRARHFIRITGPGESNVELYHDRIRETILKSLSPDRLKNYHFSLASTLETAGDADPETLAVHFEAAEIIEKASQYLTAAAEQANQALAFSRAADLYRRTIDVGFAQGEQLRSLKMKLGDALVNAGRVVEAADAYQRAAMESRDDISQEMRRLAAFHFSSSGHVEKGRAEFRKVLQSAKIRMPKTSVEVIVWTLFYRGFLRFRGLRFKRRNEYDVPRHKLRRVDAAWAVGTGMSFTDSSLGWLFTTRALLLALKAGEPSRLARSLAWEAAASGSLSVKGQQRGEQLLLLCQSIIDELASAQSKGMLALAKGLLAEHGGHWKDAYQSLNNAEDILSHCTGVPWERSVLRAFQLRCLFYLGEYEQLRLRTRELLKWARDTGDLYLTTLIGVVMSPYLLLALDRPDEALQSIDTGLAGWTPQGFHLVHACAIETRGWIELYAGHPSAGLRKLVQDWVKLRKHQFLRPVTLRVTIIHVRARLAIAAAAENLESDLIRAAENDARRLEQENLQWLQPLAHTVRAGVANIQGDKSRAIALLRQAENNFSRFHMHGFVDASRYTLGKLMVEQQGAEMTKAAEASMRRQKIENPERWANMMIPGCRYYRMR
jgi:serine/threonine protein kinase/tetratricopeptide (TPR) repeat protein